MNSKYKIFTYKSTMWADASGYYVYLPSAFIYNWDVHDMPENIDTLTGGGFSIDKENSKLFSKYTLGIAYFQLPFFAIAHVATKMSGGEANGFSQNYVNSLLFSGVFYLLMALFCLFYFLQYYFSKWTALLTCFSLFACTNLYYYGIEHPGLSHVYSFFLICFSLLVIQKNPKYLALILPLVFAVLMLIRPTNIVAILTLIFMHVNINQSTIKQTKWGHVLISCAIGFLFVLPQLMYWHWVSGNWIMYSYNNEGFIYWNRPYVIEVFFAATNGLFTYSPILLLGLIGYFYSPINKFMRIVCLLSFVFITYLNASWWCWPFGCAYGGRAFIEYFPFLGLGIAALINRFKNRQILFFSIILIFAFVNIKIIYSFDDCFYGTTWDFHVIWEMFLD